VAALPETIDQVAKPPAHYAPRTGTAEEPAQLAEEPTRAAVTAWIEKAKLKPEQCLFPSRLTKSAHVSTRQYARIVHQWVAAIGLDPTVYGTHTMRRTKATLIYRRTKNLRAVQGGLSVPSATQSIDCKHESATQSCHRKPDPPTAITGITPEREPAEKQHHQRYGTRYILCHCYIVDQHKR
jgi:hypothetical protein